MSLLLFLVNENCFVLRKLTTIDPLVTNAPNEVILPLNNAPGVEAIVHP